MVVENLLQFGLNEKEISVYLSLVSLGPAPVRLIARQARVNRGTSYDILKQLIELGLVSFYKEYQKEDKRQYFVAEPPRKLLDAVENKKRGLETLKINLGKALPELESMYEKSGAKPVVKYYEGYAGVKIILQDVIETMKENSPIPSLIKEGSRGEFQKPVYYVYSSADIRNHLYKAYPNFNSDRLAGKIGVKVIAIGKGGELAGLDERKWLSKNEGSPSYILIYSGKIAMITLDATRTPVGVVIENQGLYETQKMIFDFNWSKL